MYQLLDESDLQQSFAQYLRAKREYNKWSREVLAERSTVPASTIKKFELTGQISFRQLLLLWQCLDDLNRLYQLTQKSQQDVIPSSIEEVLNDEF